MTRSKFFLQLIALVLELVERAAPFFGDIGRELDPIQTEVRAVEQSQFFAHQQDVAEEGLDLALHRRDKGSDRAVVRGMAIGEGNEDDVFLAGAFNLSGADHAPGVGKQNDLEQDFGMDGSCTGFVVVVACIKDGQINMLVHQFADGVLQCTWDKLVLQGNGEHDQLIFVEWFEFCHCSPLAYRTLWLCAGFSHFFDSLNGLRYRRVGEPTYETELNFSFEPSPKSGAHHSSGARFVGRCCLLIIIV